jgi:hypothetical protein
VAPLVYTLTLTRAGAVTKYRVLLPERWETEYCRGEWMMLRSDADLGQARGGGVGCTVSPAGDGQVEIDLAVDVTDTYSRVRLKKRGDAYEGNFEGRSAFEMDRVQKGTARLARSQPTTRDKGKSGRPG